MYGFLYRFGTWLLGKLGAAVLIVVVALAAVGMWLYVNDQVDAETRRLQYIDQLRATQVALAAEHTTALSDLAALRDAVQQQEKRIAQANKIMTQLIELRSWWEKWFGQEEQQQANEDQIVRMTALAAEAKGELGKLLRAVNQAEIRVADLDYQIASTARDLDSTEKSESAAAHYLRDAWDESKIYLLIALAAYFFGPSIIKLMSYYLLAPWLARGKPIRFEEELVAVPHVRASSVSTEVVLWPGEVLRVKENFLQSSDDDLNRKTRFIFDWAIPITSVACGLMELVELRNGHAGEQAALTLSMVMIRTPNCPWWRCRKGLR